MKLTKKHMDELEKRISSLKSRASKLKDKAEGITETIVQTGVIGGTSFGFGLLSGYWVNDDGTRGVQLLGMPLDLGTGIGMHLLGFMAGGRWAEQWHNVGDGAIAAYLNTLGAGVGDRMRLQRGAAAPATPAVASGAARQELDADNGFGSTAGEGLSAAELQQLATA